MSVEGISIENGGRTCKACGRWAVITSRNMYSRRIFTHVPEPDFESDRDYDWLSISDSDSEESLQLEEEQDKEDIELYRQIHVPESLPLIKDY